MMVFGKRISKLKDLQSLNFKGLRILTVNHKKATYTYVFTCTTPLHAPISKMLVDGGYQVCWDPIWVVWDPYRARGRGEGIALVFITLITVFGKQFQSRPRAPWHVGPLKVGLLSVNTPQNPPDPQAYQTHRPTTRPRAHQFHGPTRPTGPPHKRAHPPGPTTPRPVVRNSEKM